VSLV
jgi:hypothetical protein